MLPETKIMNGPVRSSFLYLMNLAYKSKLYVPFLLTACFLVLDVRLQLEVHINMTRHRTRQHLGMDANDAEENDFDIGHDSHEGSEDEDNDDEYDEEEDDELLEFDD